MIRYKLKKGESVSMKHEDASHDSFEHEFKEMITALEYADLDEDDKELYDPVKNKYEKLPTAAKISFCAAAIGIIIYTISLFSPSFADFFNFRIAHYLRMIFAKITGIFSFSLAEAILISVPIIIFIVLWYIWKFRCLTWKSTLMSILSILSAVAFILTSFTLNFATGYKGSSLDKKLGLEKSPVSANELYMCAQYLIEKANYEIKFIEFDENGSSIMPYGFNEMNNKLIDAYDSFCEEFTFMKNFDSKLKPVMNSEIMSYTHITGVYTFFTGEANVNIAFPDYTIPYTAAHELAHQRGIAKEDEANMIAYLVCSRSDDPYIRYSAYLNMYEYIASALKKADADLYGSAQVKLSSKILKEQAAYSRFFKKYQKSAAATVSGKVNDAYLKSQGTPGSMSYGMVVDLTVAYFKDIGIIS